MEMVLSKKSRKKKRWIRFEEALAAILDHIYKSGRPDKCYDSALLILLYNGLRLPEAVEAYLAWVRTGEHFLEVRRTGGRRNPARPVFVKGIEHHLERCPELLEVEPRELVREITAYYRRTYGFSIYALRVALAAFLMRRGATPDEVAALLSLTNADTLLSYAWVRAVEEFIEDVSREPAELIRKAGLRGRGRRRK